MAKSNETLIDAVLDAIESAAVAARQSIETQGGSVAAVQYATAAKELALAAEALKIAPSPL